MQAGRWSKRRAGERRWKEQKLIAATGALCLFFTGHFASAHGLRHNHHRPHYYTVARQAPSPQSGDTDFGPTARGDSYIVINASTGGVVSENGADTPRYPASLTKLMTLDLAFQAIRDGRMTLDTPIPVSFRASAVEPVKLGLQPGDAITVRQAILAMTTMSANDAATALGEYLGGGSEARCAQMMTLRAHALGMAQTQFYNASGLPNPGQVTTARDLAILARDIVTTFPEDQPFFEVLKFDFRGHTVYSNDAMLKLYPGAMGMKTGYTILARHNLITAAERNGSVLIGVTLHENSWPASYARMTALLDAGFGGGTPAGGVLLAARKTPVQTGAAPGLRLAANTAPPAGTSGGPSGGIQPEYSPPNIPLPRPGPSLFPVAEAATLRPMVGRAGRHAAHTQPVRLADSHLARGPSDGWTAQVGSYARLKSAKLQAIHVQTMRGIGVAHVARVDHHGRILWAAQLAGLSQTDAHATCHALAVRGHSCMVIAPQSEHLAERDAFAG